MACRRVSPLFCGLIVLQAAFAVAALSEQKSVSSVSVQGVVFCDQCLQQKMTQSSNLLKGAKVAITCEAMKNGGEKASMVAVTNGKGEFKAYLSNKLFDNEGNIKCSASLRSSPQNSCRLPSKTAGMGFSRSSAADKSHIAYRVSNLSFRPAVASPLCAQASYYEPSPYEKPPKEEPPKEEPPVFEPPKEEPPKEEPPVFEPPKEEPPKEEPPKEEPPVYKPPVEEPPMEKPPMEKPPYEEPKFEFPKFKFPKLDFPKFKFPKFDFPKYKYPKYPPQP